MSVVQCIRVMDDFLRRRDRCEGGGRNCKINAILAPETRLQKLYVLYVLRVCLKWLFINRDYDKLDCATDGILKATLLVQAVVKIFDKRRLFGVYSLSLSDKIVGQVVIPKIFDIIALI